MKKTLLFVFLTTLFPTLMRAAAGETFTVKVNGIDMKFFIMTEGGGGGNQVCTTSQAIDWDYEGDVDIPSSVQYNGKEYTVTEIGQYSFASSVFNSVKIPSTVTKIGSHAFAYCRRNNWEETIQPVMIPASVTEIAEYAFAGMETTAINVEEGNANYVSTDGVLYDSKKEIILAYPARKTGDTYTIPSSVKRIGEGAFRGNSLTEISIPNSVTEYGHEAFAYCWSLKSIAISANVTKIESAAFIGCGNANIELANNNPQYVMVDGCIYTKNMNEIVCYPSIKTNDSYEIHNGTESIFDASFQHSKCLSVTIPNTVISIGECAFLSCNLTSIDIPASVTSIGRQAFDYCLDLTKAYFHSVTPPATEYNVFGGNENLTIYVPYNSISAYRNVTNLNRVHIDPSLDWHGEHWHWVFCCIEGIDFTQTEGLTAYKVVKNSGQASSRIGVSTRADDANSPVKFVPVDKAGPGDCVLLVGEPGKTYELHSDETAPNITDNLLKGSTDGTMVSATDGDKTNFVYNGTEFAKVTATENIEGGTGFLQISTSDVPEGTNAISLASIPKTTGIQAITTSAPTSAIYNLNGTRMKNPGRGIYIINGKKYVVK